MFFQLYHKRNKPVSDFSCLQTYYTRKNEMSYIRAEKWVIATALDKFVLDGFRYCSKAKKGTRLLIQGLGCESRIIWSAFVNEFLKLDITRDLIGFDVRGIGNSEGKPISFEQMVQDTVQIVKKEKPPIQLVGHSLGGLIALKVAEKVPEVVDSVVLVCSNPQYSLKNKSGFVWRADQIVNNQMVSCIFDKVIPRSFSEKFINEHPEIICDFKNMLSRQSPTNYSILSRIASTADALDAFDKINIPVMMVVGNEDPNITFEKTREFALRRAAMVRVISGSGHNIPLENPIMLSKVIDRFNSIVSSIK